MDWEFGDGYPKILLVSNQEPWKYGYIDDDRFDIEYNILYNADISVDLSAWTLINVGNNNYVEVTEEELAMLLLINC